MRSHHARDAGDVPCGDVLIERILRYGKHGSSYLLTRRRRPMRLMSSIEDFEPLRTC